MGYEDFSGYGAYLITPDNRLIDCEFRTHEFWIEENQEYLEGLGFGGIMSGEMLAKVGWGHITLMGSVASLNSYRVSQSYLKEFSDLVCRLVEGGALFNIILISEGKNYGWKIPFKDFRWIERMAEVRRLPREYFDICDYGS